MDYVANREHQIRQMLQALGIQHVEELFTAIPSGLMLQKPPFDDGLSEYEVLRLAEKIAAENSFPSRLSYLGAGAYEHHVPAIVGAICSKSEFLTAYTPYQAEMSQGLLQAIFEFQSVVCALTGLDVSNASVYDGACACAEAVLMSLRIAPLRSRIVIARSLHPLYRAVIDQYLGSHAIEVITVPFADDGSIQQDALLSAIDENTAAVLVQSPNFLGVLEDIAPAFAVAKERGALSILCANPVAYGLYSSAADVGADIAVGDMQPLGLPLQFGGPYVGYMACRQEIVRQMPGRIVGETVDTRGRKGYVLTLQAREQHIRREKATSNICTNQALAALASTVTTLWYGPEGLHQLALANFQHASHLRRLLGNQHSVSGHVPILNEFVVKLKEPIDQVIRRCRSQGIEPGLKLDTYFPELDRHLLVCATETKTLEQLERFATVLSDG